MRARILAVDDDRAVLTLLNVVLKQGDFDVVTCSNLREFHAARLEKPADLYLVDVGLADGNGLELVRTLRRETSAGIIILSGLSSEEDRADGIASGADEYVTKPFRLRDLSRTVSSVLELAQKRGLGSV